MEFQPREVFLNQLSHPFSSAPLLDEAALNRTLRRMAQEIAERYPDPRCLALVGIPSRGVELAERLGRLLGAADAVGGKTAVRGEPFCGCLDISMHRDDSHVRGAVSVVRPTRLPPSLDGKIMIVVDDVLQSGRTCRAALDALCSFGRPERIEYAVLVDRGMRQLPIAADYVGKRVDTTALERVFVRLLPQDGVEGVWLERPTRRWVSGETGGATV
ncbi:MAG: pyrimidine operon regulatory protein/uracil phosphoribosyltransferase [Verrucomicrobiota bacterium]